jgi:hypothetical protein
LLLFALLLFLLDGTLLGEMRELLRRKPSAEAAVALSEPDSQVNL